MLKSFNYYAKLRIPDVKFCILHMRRDWTNYFSLQIAASVLKSCFWNLILSLWQTDEMAFEFEAERCLTNGKLSDGGERIMTA